MRDIVNTSDNIKTSNMDVSNTNLKKNPRLARASLIKLLLNIHVSYIIDTILSLIHYLMLLISNDALCCMNKRCVCQIKLSTFIYIII